MIKFPQKAVRGTGSPF